MFYASFPRSSQPALAFVISSMELYACTIRQCDKVHLHYKLLLSLPYNLHLPKKSVFFIQCTIYTLLTLQSATALTSKHLTNVLYVYIAVISSA